MIYAAEIEAGTAPLSPAKALAVKLAIRDLPIDVLALYPMVEEKIDAMTDPAKEGYEELLAKAIDAAHKKLEEIGALDVSKEGGDKATYFSTKGNRDALARDVLHMLFKMPYALMVGRVNRFGLVQRELSRLTDRPGRDELRDILRGARARYY